MGNYDLGHNKKEVNKMDCQICGQETTTRTINEYRTTDYIWGVCYGCAKLAIESAKMGRFSRTLKEISTGGAHNRKFLASL